MTCRIGYVWIVLLAGFRSDAAGPDGSAAKPIAESVSAPIALVEMGRPTVVDFEYVQRSLSGAQPKEGKLEIRATVWEVDERALRIVVAIKNLGISKFFLEGDEILLRKADGEVASSLASGFCGFKRDKVFEDDLSDWASPSSGRKYDVSPGGIQELGWEIPTSGAPVRVDIVKPCAAGPRAVFGIALDIDLAKRLAPVQEEKRARLRETEAIARARFLGHVKETGPQK